MTKKRIYEWFNSSHLPPATSTLAISDNNNFIIPSGSVAVVITYGNGLNDINNAFGFVQTGTFKNIAGTVSQVGSTFQNNFQNDTGLNTLATVTYQITNNAIQVFFPNGQTGHAVDIAVWVKMWIN